MANNTNLGVGSYLWSGFKRGLINKSVQKKYTVDWYKDALKQCTNFIMTRTANPTRRTGLYSVANFGTGKVINFSFNPDNTAENSSIIVFGAGFIRFFKTSGEVYTSIATSYTLDSLETMALTQQGYSLIITTATHPPYSLKLLGTTWQFKKIVFTDGAYDDQIVSALQTNSTGQLVIDSGVEWRNFKDKIGHLVRVYWNDATNPQWYWGKITGFTSATGSSFVNNDNVLTPNVYVNVSWEGNAKRQYQTANPSTTNINNIGNLIKLKGGKLISFTNNSLNNSNVIVKSGANLTMFVSNQSFASLNIQPTLLSDGRVFVSGSTFLSIDGGNNITTNASNNSITNGLYFIGLSDLRILSFENANFTQASVYQVAGVVSNPTITSLGAVSGLPTETNIKVACLSNEATPRIFMLSKAGNKFYIGAIGSGPTITWTTITSSFPDNIAKISYIDANRLMAQTYDGQFFIATISGNTLSFASLFNYLSSQYTWEITGDSNLLIYDIATSSFNYSDYTPDADIINKSFTRYRLGIYSDDFQINSNITQGTNSWNIAQTTDTYPVVPLVVSFYQGRSAWGATRLNPNLLVFSNTNDIFNLSPTTTDSLTGKILDTTANDNAIVLRILQTKAGLISHLISKAGGVQANDVLWVFTTAGLFLVYGLNGALNQSNAVAEFQNSIGASPNIYPIDIYGAQLIVAQTLREIQTYQFEYAKQAIIPQNISLLSSELLTSGIVDADLILYPTPRLLITLQNGNIVNLTIDIANEVISFSLINIPNAQAQSLSIIPTINGYYTAGVIMKRGDNYYLDFTTPEYEGDISIIQHNDLFGIAPIYLDSCVFGSLVQQPSGAWQATINTARFNKDFITNKTITLILGGKVYSSYAYNGWTTFDFPADQVGDFDKIFYMGIPYQSTLEVLPWNETATQFLSPLNQSLSLQYISLAVQNTAGTKGYIVVDSVKNILASINPELNNPQAKFDNLTDGIFYEYGGNVGKEIGFLLTNESVYPCNLIAFSLLFNSQGVQN